jgi:hypothetical protein
MAKRELIEPKPGDIRYIRRDEKEHYIDEQDDVGKSPIRDRRKHAKDEPPPGSWLSLYLDETVQVDGNVEGDIFAETLILGEAAFVTGQISGHTVVIKGQVTGDISARARVEICVSGKLHGNVVAPNLVIHEGGMFEGRCSRNVSLRGIP